MAGGDTAAAAAAEASAARPTHEGAPLTRVSGRTWKEPKRPAHRSMMPKALRRSYEQRMQQAREHKALKQAEQELRDEKAAEKAAHRDRLIERRKKREEAAQRERYDAEMASRKRLRMKRKELRARAHAKH
ncbi:hypothetical protein H4R21_005685 [Coemansia helicoidea]|uniref:Uncharacterized protein n=1 Tax=Coemansia helicoidea TaxID=1286919 RepID=A0ACC1KSR5_9FUNG|nr:hypothetical protein H4R21_005685 [Coemansia helicoidea]